MNQLLLTSKPMNRLQAQLTMLEAYDVTFGIFDHLRQAHIERANSNPNVKRPLAAVALHPAENWAAENTELDRFMRAFVENNIGEVFRISFTEFLAYPRDYVERLVRIAKEDNKRRTRTMAAAEAGMSQDKA